ncbi:hypothetical protein [Bergeyella cardium]|uniref:Uncharacterized protein n=1 Tax=Bergeyella cardium TaxID=1585976 RepID=A0A6P1QUP8_9FLAO|nr:hypothetical protein [Bergeyella cardium]QHN65425.1 hypothetical protein DBX24_05770 [Bergeyella cardium]WHE33004.1 hypothetical protein P8603_05800 [Bergeyella cardium]WHF59655.1 hypothetical protein O0R51_05795 [Bergeyella cardium]
MNKIQRKKYKNEAVITHMDDYTAYVNPYFVVQKGEAKIKTIEWKVSKEKE